ncbi:unnamed protein product, partial [Heterotrigona itama]
LRQWYIYQFRREDLDTGGEEIRTALKDTERKWKRRYGLAGVK